MRYSHDDLNKILELHLKWINREGDGGQRANLEGADLWCANLEGANLWCANLEGADLGYADLGYANLRYADLRGANLEGADLGYAELRCANLQCANLEGADLEGAELRCANLQCANLKNITGKFIFTFQIGKDFAYFCDGILKIGCKTDTLEEWINSYQKIGETYNYSLEQIEEYGGMIKYLYGRHIPIENKD